MFQVDPTLRVGDVLMVILTLIILPAVKTFGKAIFTMRDELLTMKRDLGETMPPSGVLGDIGHIKQELRRHRDWLIDQGIIHPSDRT